MSDEALYLLHSRPDLRKLLEHYAALSASNKDPQRQWFDRIMPASAGLPEISTALGNEPTAELEPEELSLLHGTLIAKGWMELRVGVAHLTDDGQLTDCYRITKPGKVLVERLRHPFSESGMPFIADTESLDASDATVADADAAGGGHE